MKRRYDGFPINGGLVVLDSFTGDVKVISIDGMSLATETRELNTISGTSTSKNALSEMSDFDREVCSTYPYPVAKPYLELLAETDPRQKCKLMVDTFTAVLKLMALQIASEYIRAKDVKDILVNQALKRDIQRPLISAWNSVLRVTIPVLAQNDVSFFSPELVRAYDNLEIKCKDKVMVEKHYEDDNGRLVTKRSPFAKIQALIKYRNSLAHGFNQSRERAVKELEIYLPVLQKILEEVRYMSRYTLWHVASKDENVEGIRLMGSHPSKQMLKIDRSLLDPGVSPVFLVNESTLEVLPMFSFLDIDISEGSNIAETGKDIFIFDGNTDSTVIYLATASGQHLEKKSRMKHWKELLRNKELELKMISEKDLDIQKLCAMASLTTEQTIQTLINSGKFIPEVTLKRDDLERYLDQFLLGDYGAIVIGGESGIGKSTLLADKVSDWIEEGNPVLFYKASSLNSPEIGQKFIRDMGIKISFPEEFFALVEDTMTTSGKYFYLVIDAVNEFNGDVNMLINAIETLVSQGAPYRWFRVVITVRDSSYNRAHARFGSRVPERYLSIEIDQAGEKESKIIIPLGRLTENTVGLIYEKYRFYLVKDADDENDLGYHIFKPHNAFIALDPLGSTVEMMKSPLMMRLILQAFNRKELPSNLSIDEAMQIYLDEVISEVNNPIRNFKARKHFLTALVKTLNREGTDTLRKDELIINSSLKEAILNPQKDSPYVQLLDLGVLMEEWEEGECFVRFSFDRLFEFLLAEEHDKREINVAYLESLVQRSFTFKSLEGAIQIIMVRLVSRGKRNLIIQLIDGFNPEEDRSIQLVVGFLKTLFYADRHEFTQLTENLPEDPTTSDLRIISELLKSNLVFSTTETERLLEIMLKIAKFLNDLSYQADVLCLTGNHLYDLHEFNNALIKYQEAQTLFEKLNNLDGIARAYNLIGKIYIEIDPVFCDPIYTLEDFDPEMLEDKNDSDLSMTESSLLEMVPNDHSWLVSLSKAYEINKLTASKDAKKRMVDTLVNLAVGYSRALGETPLMHLFDSLDEKDAEELRLCKEKYILSRYLEALKIAIEIDCRKTQSTIYNNLAYEEMRDTNYRNALEYIDKGILLAESTGNSEILGNLYWNLAACKVTLEEIGISEYLDYRLKAAEHLKRSGSLLSEIDHLESLLKPLRHLDVNELFDDNDKELINSTFVNLLFDLSDRWYHALTSSKFKDNLNDRDARKISRLFEIFVEIPFSDLDMYRKLIPNSSPITQIGAIIILYESDRMKSLNFKFSDVEILSLFSNITVESGRLFNRHITEEEFEEFKVEILELNNFLTSLVNDDWNLLLELSKPRKKDDGKKYERRLLEQLQIHLSWCLSKTNFNSEMAEHGITVKNYLKSLKKDKNMEGKLQVPPLAILLLEKLINGKKPSKKEITDCVNNFSIIYVDEFPLAFFYRLITYLYEVKDNEMLKTVFKKLDEESIKWTEVWPRSAEVMNIWDEVLEQ